MVNDPTTIANEFNSYFASIGPKMAANIPPTNHHHSSYLTNPNSSFMFINPATETEILDIIVNRIPNHIIPLNYLSLLLKVLLLIFLNHLRI